MLQISTENKLAPPLYSKDSTLYRWYVMRLVVLLLIWMVSVAGCGNVSVTRTGDSQAPNQVVGETDSGLQIMRNEYIGVGQ
jgi:hypothetical protein